MNKFKMVVFLGIVAFNNQIVVATDGTDINDFFAQAKPNPTYGTQYRGFNDTEKKSREIIEKNELVGATNIQELFNKEKSKSLRLQQERTRKGEEDEKEACIKRNKEEANRRQVEEDTAFRAKVTSYIMVEDKDRRGVYVRKGFKEFFGEDGTVYDKFPRNRQHFGVSFPNGDIYDYDDGYSTWFLEYETPAKTPFMTNEDGTFSYQLDYTGRKLFQTVSKVNYPYAIQ